MTRPSAVCAHEADVLELVAIGQWPARADESLRAHVDGCESCREVAVVASAVVTRRDAMAADVRLPDASVVWFAADRRVRTDAARRAEQPIAAVEILAVTAGAAALGAGVVAGRLNWDALSRWFDVEAVRARLPSAGALANVLETDLSPILPWALLATGALAVVATVAVSIAALADRTR